MNELMQAYLKDFDSRLRTGAGMSNYEVMREIGDLTAAILQLAILAHDRRAPVEETVWLGDVARTTRWAGGQDAKEECRKPAHMMGEGQ